MISRFQSEAEVNKYDNKIHTFNNFLELEEHIQHSKSSMDRLKWKDQFCSFDCTSAVKQWGGILPVSDDVTGDIYVNKVCAMCHDVTKMTPWRMSVYCRTDSKYINYIDVMVAVGEGRDFPKVCTLFFTPPSQHRRYDVRNFLEEDNLRCLKTVYDTFPRTCRDPQFSIPLIYKISKEEIVAACENTSNPFEFGYGLDRLEVFTDKMCALCNGMYNSEEYEFGETFFNINGLDFYEIERTPVNEPSTEVCEKLNAVSN